MKRSETATKLFQNGCNCSQSVLEAFNDITGYSKEETRQMAAPFGGGYLGMGLPCGVVSGAFMVISRLTWPKDNNEKQKLYSKCLMNNFKSIFEEKNRSILCRDLLGKDISSTEQYNEAKDLDLFKKACPLFVQSAVEILETYIIPQIELN